MAGFARDVLVLWSTISAAAIMLVVDVANAGSPVVRGGTHTIGNTRAGAGGLRVASGRRLQQLN